MSEEIIDTGIIEEPIIEAPVEVVEEPVVEVPVVEEPAAPAQPEHIPAATPTPTAKPVEGVVVSGKDVDEVYLAKCVYKNKFERKSLTIHHLQRRLAELGYPDAASDKDGYLGDLTQLSIEKFQEANGLPVGKIDETTFSKIFQGDPHVHVNL